VRGRAVNAPRAPRAPSAPRRGIPLAADTRQQVQECATVARFERSDFTGRFLNTPQHHGGVTLEDRPGIPAARFDQERFELRGQPRRGARCRPVLIDEAARRRFERGRQRLDRLRHIVVDARQKVGWSVPDEERPDQQEKCRLALTKVPHHMHNQTEVALPLTDDHG
jgi:hypothetical protein